MTTTDTRPGLVGALRSSGSWIARYAFLAAFAALFVFFSVQATSFLSGSNLLNALQGSMILLLIALALTLVISSGGIDLSAGTALDFGAWFAIAAMATYGLPWPLAVLCALAGGALVGSVNAFLIVTLGVTPFLATLGTFFIGRSLQQIGTGGGANINYRDAPEGFRALTSGSTLFIPNEVLLVGIVLVVFYLYLQRSKHGVRIEAMGLQDSAARTAGLRTRRYRAGIYIAAGVTCAVAGILLSSGLRIYTPMAGFSYLLDGIAAVFIGASMHPRARPNVLGTLAGVLFLSMLNNGLDLLGLDFNAKAALRGLVLLVALTLAFLIAKQARRTTAVRAAAIG
ncbi:ABC transporter permease [Naasia sp. SYSU D00948]|uniref:ABC transporter permease n=1 Tax=Naasia sp. SYSU D00948 TaxID=2817379 RepID=UPI001B3066F5|nr:ABC transporter permease [Naasia sp. SYSU D00948]